MLRHLRPVLSVLLQPLQQPQRLCLGPVAYAFNHAQGVGFLVYHLDEVGSSVGGGVFPARELGRADNNLGLRDA
eukprot:CAMPEP_0173407724 /NCGR_PEP_ID=MMETSP1356-20130122/67930_1 /TAXON_ID=77927 ORGANISM="Hemiselmis virescens, Strain PCC157" /NCGR_SAMPLE_ID=MMETSP1356 /ASSEMBLY_ACC=CAM_ASM_000847 /LENGTH=73 /DNA_ID=CAMNT_0014368941 /DNA_START=89 /DNA_END=306 /DNA_ORIENTATION=-